MTGATQDNVQHTSRPTPGPSMDPGRIRAARILQEPTGSVTFASVAIVLVGIVLLPQHVSGDDAVREVMLRQMVDGNLIAPTAAVALWLILRERRLRFALLPVAVLALTVIESSAVTGRLSWTRYSADVERGMMALLPWGDVSGFGWPLWSGLLAILFSFGRGLFFFIPQLWNGPSRTRDSVADVERLLWIVTATLVPIYAMWWAWYGGVSFGPRFFMIAVVAGGFAASSVVSDRNRSRARTVVVLIATIASAWVAVSGAVFGVTTRAFEECVSGGTFEREALCLYTPEYSGIWAPIWAADPIGSRDLVFVVTVLLALVPTFVAILSPESGTLRDTGSSVGRHLRGQWRL